MKSELIKLLDSYLGGTHFSNLSTKLNAISETDKKYPKLEEVIREYCRYRDAIKESLESKSINFSKLVNSLNSYKSFVSEANEILKYSAQSKFEPTILEEFLYLLFQKLPYPLTGGKAHAYSSLYFNPRNIKEFINAISFEVNYKDQDFALFRNVTIQIENRSRKIAVPIIAIECKTYLDKTMLEGSVATAEKIKKGNPFAKFIIVTEAYDVDYEVDISSSDIDNIYVLRKGRRVRGPGANPISADVIESLYTDISNYLSQDWRSNRENIEKAGKIFI